MKGWDDMSGGVGSKVAHPWPGIHASTQLWASEARTTQRSEMGLYSPIWNPVASRAGIPSVRNITAMAEAKYSQWPLRRGRENRPADL